MENIGASYKYPRKSPSEAKGDFFETTSSTLNAFLSSWLCLANFAVFAQSGCEKLFYATGFRLLYFDWLWCGFLTCGLLIEDLADVGLWLASSVCAVL